MAASDSPTQPSSPTPARPLVYTEPNGDLWIANADSSRPRKLLDGPIDQPTLSHDGRTIAYLRRLAAQAPAGQQVEIVNVDGSSRRVVVPRRPVPAYLQVGGRIDYQIYGEVRWAYDDASVYYLWNYGNIGGKGISRHEIQKDSEEDLGIYAWGFEPLTDGRFAVVWYENACESLPCDTGIALTIETPHSPSSAIEVVKPGEPFSYAVSPSGELLAYTVQGTLHFMTAAGEPRGDLPIGTQLIEKWADDGQAVVVTAKDGQSTRIDIPRPS